MSESYLSFSTFAAATNALMDFCSEVISTVPGVNFTSLAIVDPVRAEDPAVLLAKFQLGVEQELDSLDLAKLNSHEFKSNQFFYCAGFEVEFSAESSCLAAVLHPMD